MNTKAVVIDDEQNIIDHMVFLLEEHCPQVTVVATANNADEGIAIIREHDPGIVFLDIQMPGRNGFDMLRSLQQYSFELIFVTGYDKYGIQAVKFAALDYLLKPVDPDELIQAVQKAMERSQEKEQNKQAQSQSFHLEQLVRILHQNQNLLTDKLALTSQHETRFISINRIIRCEASNSYTKFILENKENIVVSKTLNEYHELLTGFGFVRCHQTHLVNKQYIKSWVKRDDYLLLADNSSVPVARTKKDLVKEQLKLL